ncbi:uncharacterized protein FOMMEDRAFT_16297 [Fomitiporia mediterranea MF3/22]|uniref:uncharacterized protein n=1 Tax=Fomitiporia mediterranea (strain MF3/22) TaxID=694068 RepID=UPI0004408570|nr:uncharacterized protein FOMMEDRAFT_16297 [Fomitiporia mediterranea MF3/22]EJD07669.1 hypothetical protein FOMMEDRAFT_16297 [Fomitiporia mediterranea MF3/22]
MSSLLLTSAQRNVSNRAVGHHSRIGPSSKRATDKSPRVFIENKGLRSAGAEIGGSNTLAFAVAKKRKVDLLDDGSESSASGGLKACRSCGKARRHKVPKFTRPASPGKTKVRSQRLTDSARENISVCSVHEHPSGPDVSKTAGEKRLRLSRNTDSAQRPKPEGSQREEDSGGQMKEELSALRTEVDRARRVIQAQQKSMKDLEKEVGALKRMNRKQGSQIDNLKSTRKKSEDQLNLVQENLQCQICLEVLSKPHTLVPCGHVFCQGCLQSWFRTGRQPGEDDDDRERVPTIFRIKTCPCCRSLIQIRPVPLFILKNVLSAFATENQTENITPDEEPWKDIFPSEADLLDDVSDSDDFDSEDASTSSSGDDEYIRQRILVVSESEDSEDEDENEDGNDVGDDEDEGDETSSSDDDVPTMHRPARALAHYRNEITQRMHPQASAEHLQLLQRGVKPQMIGRFRVRFDAQEGIVARMRSGTDVYLGWNIMLPMEDFPDGRIFMRWVAINVTENPGSWIRTHTGRRIAFKRLIPRYQTTEILGFGA